MGLLKLNNLAQAYLETKSANSFEDMYKEAKTNFLQLHRARLIRSGWGDTNDADEIFDSTILKLSRRDDLKDFGKSLSNALLTATLDFIKSARRYRNRFELTIDKETDDAPTLTVSDEYQVEDIVFTKGKGDQRQLITFILESAKIHEDPTMTDIIEGIKYYPTINALAGALGLQRNTVDRKLRRLARLYLPKDHGDITDYLPRYMEVKREFITA